MTDAATWQEDRLAEDAIEVARELPPDGQQVIGWVSDADVAIHYFPLIVWRIGNEWWGGLPGKYLNLTRLEWTVTHWKPISGARR
jgi:hypothetical protein